jgi:hypothetical protein
MMVSAEYHGPSKTAYFYEHDISWVVICSIKFFVKVVLLFQEHYGKLWYEEVGKDTIFVGFGKTNE